MMGPISDRAKELRQRLTNFMGEVIYPAEQEIEAQHRAQPSRWQVPPILEKLKVEARSRGLWNLFLPDSEHGAGLSNLEYATLCETMGWSPVLAPEACNCSAPDTGNM